jgi:lipopolysaccharide/colanic/teichoic acid biosynthesis glycosyltransferase
MSPMEIETQQTLARKNLGGRAPLSIPTKGDLPSRMLLNEDAFVSMLYLERRRAERAQKRFVLILVDVKKSLEGIHRDRTILALTKALSDATRETDIIGWYDGNDLMAVIGTELGKTSKEVVEERFLSKLRLIFNATLGMDKSSSITVSFHFFPDEYQDGESGHTANIALYPDIHRMENTKRVSLAVKRCIDVVGSGAALLFLSPLFATVALGIKATSKGPVLFKQERLGQGGKPFTVLKFRSMRTDCDAKIHQQYVEQFIAGQANGDDSQSSKPVFKIQKDPRVTSLGRFLRKTSLDELPQFWNVLRGDMSLVGPRPAIDYEFRAYEVWHRRRVLEIKPGITGLWQVEGRSRTRFDEMVRLDLKYARVWSIWLDLKILLLTPAAVFSGEGAH